MTRPPKNLTPHTTMDAYVMDPNPYDWGALLAPFSPPLTKRGKVFLASFFGDVWVEDREGGVWWVNGLEERIDRYAINQDKAMERIWAENLVTLKTKLLEQLIKGDKLLPAGMLYGLKAPRSEGGKYHPDNIGTAPVAEAFAYMGARFKAKDAPPPKPPEKMPPEKPKNGLWGKKK